VTRRRSRAWRRTLLSGAPAGALAASVALVCAPAAASPLFELAGSQRGGFSGRGSESGAASTYFNPAFLPDADEGLELGIFALSDQIGVHLQGRSDPSVNVTAGTENAQRPGGGRYPTYGVPTDWLENGKPAEAPDEPLKPRPRQGAGSGQNVRLYQMIGLVTKLFKGRVGLGLYAMIPYNEFTGAAAFFNDEREQYFSNSLHPELYADRLTATSLAFGTGVKVTDELNFGVSFTLSLKTTASTPTYLVDVGRTKDILVDTKVSVQAAVAPHFGAVYKPKPWITLSGTLHTPQKFEIGTNFSFLLASGLEQGAELKFTHAYLPWTGALGADVEVWRRDRDAVRLVTTLALAGWSAYVDRHGEKPSGAFAWYDTISGTVGGRYQHKGSRVLLDATFQPSPVPTQSGRTSYVDNARAGLAAGFDQRFDVFGAELRAGFQLQAHRLLPRATQKLTPNGDPALVRDEVPDDAVLDTLPDAAKRGLRTNSPGWPGFSSEGAR